MGEVLGYLGTDAQKCAVRNRGHSLDFPMVVANESQVFDERAQAVPSRKRGCLDQPSGEMPMFADARIDAA